MIVVPADALLCGFCCAAPLRSFGGARSHTSTFCSLFNKKKLSSLTALRAVCEQVPPCADAIALAHAAGGI